MNSNETGMAALIENNGGLVSHHKYRAYSKHEKEEQLWEWFEEFEGKFPVELTCDFIEVSTRMSSYHAKAYYRDGGEHQYIRFSKQYIERASDRQLRQTLLHEMVHLYTYEMGFEDINDQQVIFKWLCGRVGCKVNAIDTESPVWINLAEPMIEE